MIQQSKSYPEYKKSRQPWLDRIPAHWEEKRAKYYFREVDERSTSGAEQLMSVSHKTGVTPRKAHVTMFMAESNVGHKVCHSGDLVINTMWAWMAALGVARQTGLVSPAYGVYRPRTGSVYESDFIDNLLRIQSYVSEYICRSTGIRASRLRLYPEDFLDIPIVRPPLEEQQSIVRFIAHHDRLIRRFIRNRRRLIQLLNEQKQAIINQVVTRGLDPQVRLKPSGVEWLGDVPEHWEVRRLKQVCRFLYGFSLPDENRQPGIIAVYGSNGPVGAHNTPNTHAPCIVIGRKGSFGKINYSATEAFAIDTTFFIDDRSSNVNLRWLFHILSWARLDAVSKDSAVPGLDRNDAYATIVPYCPSADQELIASYIDGRLAEITTIIDRAEKEITLIQEYRARLIADVVTGKVDVRGFEAAAVEVGSEDGYEPYSEEASEEEDATLVEEATDADD